MEKGIDFLIKGRVYIHKSIPSDLHKHIRTLANEYFNHFLDEAEVFLNDSARIP